MKYIQQLDMTDCGAACLAMIASYFGKSSSIAEIRQYAGTDTIGTNFNGLIIAAKKYGMKANALKGNSSAINVTTPVPFIAHLHIEKKGDETWVDHFVVVKKITKRCVEIWDPNPLVKKTKIDINLFHKEWTGYALFFEPDYDIRINEKKDNLFIKFLPFFLPYKKNILYSLIASVLIVIFGLLCSFYFKYVFDELIYSKAINSLMSLSLGIMMIVILKIIIETIRAIVLSHLSFKTDLHLGFSYLSHILKLPLSFFETRKSGEILSRMDDLDKIKMVMSKTILSGVMDALMMVISGPILWNISSKLSFISFLSILFVSIISVAYSYIYREYYTKIMGENAELQSFLFESINGIATIKALNAEEKCFEGYEIKRMKLNESKWKINNYSISHSLISGLIDGCTSILIFWVGAFLIIENKISFGTLITFNSILVYFTGPVLRLVGIQNSLQEAVIAAERVGEILELEWEQDENEQLLKPEFGGTDIVLQNVTFRYGSRFPIYKNLSLSIHSGEWTGIVGPSGSGKSTLIKLIMKFYKTEQGKILLGDVNINDIDTKHLRESIGYVPQDIFLFSGTVLENIALHHPEAKFDDIVEAAKRAGAHEFIDNLPKGYETVLGEHGGCLSGGEKQRIALARALLGSPSVIILDEATSNLDTISEKIIHDVICKLRNEKLTVILIAHRLSTVKNCDKIIVIDKGIVTEEGNHLYLMKKNGLYKKMWSSSK